MFLIVDLIVQLQPAYMHDNIFSPALTLSDSPVMLHSQIHVHGSYLNVIRTWT